jgi:hypothetical protein
MSRLRDKIPVPPSAAALNKRDYAIGILLLLSVVVLWTSSNFITQVSTRVNKSNQDEAVNQGYRIFSRRDTINLFCELYCEAGSEMILILLLV